MVGSSKQLHDEKVHDAIREEMGKGGRSTGVIDAGGASDSDDSEGGIILNVRPTAPPAGTTILSGQWVERVVRVSLILPTPFCTVLGVVHFFPEDTLSSVCVCVSRVRGRVRFFLSSHENNVLFWSKNYSKARHYSFTGN